MSAPAKFLFDQDFARGAEAKPGVSPADLAAKLAEAEAAGYRNGLAAAEAQNKADAQRRLAAALERIAAGLDAINRSLAGVEARLETEAVEVAVAAAKKLAGELVAREPFAEVAALVTDCFRHLVATPHLVVRINDALYDLAKEKLDAMTQAHGFQGRLVILAEPDVAPGDCRIEWADGGIVRDRAAAEAAIEYAVTRYLKARAADKPTAIPGSHEL
jgi:flagellar assembly protein FliH